MHPSVPPCRRCEESSTGSRQTSKEMRPARLTRRSCQCLHGKMHSEFCRNPKVSSDWIFEVSIRALRLCTGEKCLVIKIFFPCLDLDSFSRKCTSLYQTDHNCSIFDRLMVYSGLSIICSDLSSTMDGAESERNHLLSRSFSQHVLKSVDVMPAILTASWDGVEALMAAVSRYVLISRSQELTFLAIGICLP